MTNPAPRTDLEQRIQELERHNEELSRSAESMAKGRHYLYEAQVQGKVATWEYDVSADQLRWAPELYKISGVDASTEISLDNVLNTIVCEEDRERLRTHFKGALRGEPYDIEHRIITEDGQTKWLRDKCRIETDDKGRVVHVVGVCQDITENKEAERKLLFFRDATASICGNLQIECAMQDLIAAIGDMIPVDRMFMQIYESDFGAMRTIADATLDKARAVDLLTPIPDQAREVVRRNLRRFLDGAVVIDTPEKNPVAREMLRFHGIEGWSVMRMTLMTEGGNLGGVVFTAEGPDRYTDTHRDLLTLLKKPFTVALLNTLRHREVLKLKELLAEDNRYLHRELHRLSGDEIVGARFGLRTATDMASKVAVLDSPVLLLGETGVGKDVIANAIHFSSPRKDGPFVKVNCGAIPDTLIDSELFGHEKGAFTGAINQKKGCFERAMGGTVFLDEIGELPLQAQVRLLRVLQEKQIDRVGGTKTIDLDIRVIAATNRDLEAMVTEGDFRQDLWFRLNVFPIVVPPLRERTGDIPALVEHFVERKASELKLAGVPAIAEGAVESLMNYDWPGNVRELANIVERALILNPTGPIQFDRLGSSQPHAAKVAGTVSGTHTLDELVAGHIRDALAATDGKIHGKGGAAERLGVNPNTLRSRMEKLGVKWP